VGESIGRRGTAATWIVASACGAGILFGTLAPRTGRSASLDVGALRLVFDESFHDLSISAHGPGTRWTAHTPWGGDFGDAAFVDPQPGFPFALDADGMFRIEMRRQPTGQWQSGLLASVDSAGRGFKLRYGYFEMRAKLPAGPGVWPAFWLNASAPKESADPSVEVDVFEQYGKFPGAYNSTVTVWPKDRRQRQTSDMKIIAVPPGSLSDTFHRYGVKIDPEWITFYLDRSENWRIRTPAEQKYGFMILADLGLGSGWPIDHTPSPSYLTIDYIRAYADSAIPP
jgi:hypothetical protein